MRLPLIPSCVCRRHRYWRSIASWQMSTAPAPRCRQKPRYNCSASCRHEFHRLVYIADAGHCRPGGSSLPTNYCVMRPEVMLHQDLPSMINESATRVWPPAAVRPCCVQNNELPRPDLLYTSTRPEAVGTSLVSQPDMTLPETREEAGSASSPARSNYSADLFDRARLAVRGCWNRLRGTASLLRLPGDAIATTDRLLAKDIAVQVQ